MRLDPFHMPQPKTGAVSIRFGDRKLDELHQQSEDAHARFGKHLDCIEPVERWYKLRDVDPKARKNAITACERQIAMSHEAMAAWNECGRLNDEILRHLGDKGPRKPWGVPSHTSFTQLAIIREKDCDCAQAIRLCQQAKNDGWAGDWDKRIARLETKVRKALNSD